VGQNLSDLYDRVLQKHKGNYGDVFNMSEDVRAGAQRPPELSSLSPEETVQFNRISQSADVPMTAALAIPYEGLKAVEQKTGLPALSLPGRALNKLGVPVALPNTKTSPASMANVKASLLGLRKRLGI